MKKQILTLISTAAAIVLCCSLLTSCQSKEEKVISQLETVCKAAEKGNLDAKDLESLQAKYETIHQSAKECDFTNEQLTECPLNLIIERV
jgi:peptidoglycan hydrolase CwlO-like protein